MKPFKSPFLHGTPKESPIDLTASDQDDAQPPPYKKRRLLIHLVEESPPKGKAAAVSPAASAPRKPLLVVKNPVESKEPAAAFTDGQEFYYNVLWRKFTTKKHKTWDGDGILSVYGGYAHLQDVSGREMGKTVYRDALLPGSELKIGGKDIEVDSIISKKDFLAGRPFIGSAPKGVEAMNAPISKPKVKSSVALSLAGSYKTTLGNSKSHDMAEIPAKSFYASSNKALNGQFKTPMLSSTNVPQDKNLGPKPRHDPNAPNALIMQRAPAKYCPTGRLIVDVVLDPFLGQHLREHQREGVKFLYECVMGMRSTSGQGALLADEMGLGKTLQTIALLWTLLKQNPYQNSKGVTPGVIKKALIVCPVTLIKNWKKEFNKWLGNEKLGVFVADDLKNKIRITDFTHGKSYSVMIIGYEKLRSVQDELKKGAGIDIVIADEGHRLKTAQNKSALAIKALDAPMRVILSGTPLQNDLSEFFTMVDFINPNLLGTYNTFKKQFEAPILKSRQPGASTRDIEMGAGRGEELSELTRPLILRRTAEILSKYLPPKTEFVLFCKPTLVQQQVYQAVLASPAFGSVLGSTEASLQLITMLKKVCNAPSLLVKKDDKGPTNPNVAALLEVIPSELMQKSLVAASSKFRVLDKMLKWLSHETKEKIVLVSNYTSTLDLIQNHLASMDLPFLRLDGSTPAGKRQDLVDKFNRTPASANFAFLLSAKSGGAGINLIGASRLVLFDVDWNPATDLQAMARIHRDGQKRPVKIYRFLMAGGMDEKIYQRQVTKMGLADNIVDGKKNEASFSANELRDLFRLDINAQCQTHELLGCECRGSGLLPLTSIAVEGAPTGEQKDEEMTNNESDDEDLFPSIETMMATATKANMAALDKRIADEAREKRMKQAKGKMQALMQYAHIDTSMFLGDTKDEFGHDIAEVSELKKIINDEMLMSVLQNEKCKVGFVFSKQG